MTEQLTSAKVALCEQYEREAYTLLFESIGPLQMDYGLSSIPTGNVTQFTCREAPNVTLLNRLLGLGIEKPATAEEIDRAARRSTTLRVACNAYIIEGYTQPVGLPALLKERGFLPKARTSVLIFDPKNTPGTSPVDHIQVEAVPISQSELFSEVVCEGFELRGGFRRVWKAISHASVASSRQKCYLAYMNGTPVGGATLVLSKDGKYAGLYSTSTLPEYRHHGVQSALLHVMLQEAIKRGVSIITAQTAYDGSAQRNLQKQGFMLGYVRESFVLPSPGRV
jgi:GNAT superfamily N-acetyltransferase